MSGGYRAFRAFPPLRDPHAIPPGPVVAFAPHPDDEIIGCGGQLAFHRERGDEVHVVLFTAGEHGDPSQLQAGELTAVRAEESRRALEVLGIGTPVGLGLPDGQVAADAATVAKVAEQLERCAPRVVYAPSPMECHPDHLACCWTVAEALASRGGDVELNLYEVNHMTLTSFVVDITPRIERLREALQQFRSQLRYQDVVGKCLAAAYARTINIALPDVQYAEGYLQVAPADVPALWDALDGLSRWVR